MKQPRPLDSSEDFTGPVTSDEVLKVRVPKWRIEVKSEGEVEVSTRDVGF
jgi:hypothetical protein